jgi:hypothetical protein
MLQDFRTRAHAQRDDPGAVCLQDYYGSIDTYPIMEQSNYTGILHTNECLCLHYLEPGPYPLHSEDRSLKVIGAGSIQCDKSNMLNIVSRAQPKVPGGPALVAPPRSRTRCYVALANGPTFLLWRCRFGLNGILRIVG